ncbi:D-alanyl-D-alanine carboxypeptidase/D-alanyl-D-alanine-endopeptidase [Salipiger sp. 1_MG-2023]|uniref:D-alanyl-D-alanine carboxypeptidase/D-alanyl-D-alanine endopeptidase n=1 Tax=Salipiger sp. 1_MG-2023 TaxID=3062665 RepID=UPI0026E281D1|nr:D-alanyl-D-alanine carboxypeptidase/D-alanyl-D-alanine-endopeptidase [Salipiger sp. 1_MG-2023]MDO6584908.1 D-alanyl-D-alanine carboxypeptidase/D-alanyl-D-alanine-endopeptidase [Salipiger sp. 1_MG-2023]
MTHQLSRRHFLAALGASGIGAATPALAGAPTASLRPVARGEDLRLRSIASAEELIAAAKLSGAVGFTVLDAATGTVIDSHAPTHGLPPASVAKAITASYALAVLGPDHRFNTDLLATGEVVEGVLKGDLILLGGGDPTLDTDGMAELVLMLKAAGVARVEGRFLVCGGTLPYTPTIDPGQPEHVGYSPAVSGLALNYNRVHFEWHKGGNGYQVSMDAPSPTLRPAVRMASMGVITRDVPLYTYHDGGARDEWTVARGALGNSGARWLPVRKPDRYAGEVFQVLAGGKGVSVPAPEMVATCPPGTLLARKQSAPLADVLRDMLKWSTNLTAEMVGLAATRARLGEAQSMRHSAAEMSAWARSEFGLEQVALVDHSGLGEDSRITSQDMAKLLLRQRVGLKALLKPMPLRDSTGKVFKDASQAVHAKTGTLNFVSGLAGYVDLDGGEELVFAFFSGDLDRRATLSKAQRERPEGGKAWNTRAKMLQQALIERWAVLAEA